MAILIGLTLILTPIGTSGTSPPLFSIDTVDSTAGWVGYDHDLYVDGSGTPHISYSWRTSDPNSAIDLKYATREDGRWMVELVDSTFRWGEQSSIVVDAEGIPHIAYTHYSGGFHVVRHAWKEGGVWSTEIIARGGEPSIAIDSLGSIHIVFIQSYPLGYSLHYAFRRTGAWSIRTIDSAEPEDYWIEVYRNNPSIAVTAGGVPHILYMEEKTRHVGSGEETITEVSHLTWNLADGWVSSIIDSAVGRGWNNIIKLDQNEDPHVSYMDREQGGARYATRAGNSWVIETVDPIWGHSNALSLDNTGQPHITYLRNDPYQVRYTRKVRGEWTTSIVATEAAGSTGLAVDARGAVHITFHDFYGQQNLMYARSRFKAIPDREENPHGPAETRLAVAPNPTFDFQVYPNPAIGTIQILFQAPGFESSAVEVFDVSGRLVRTLTTRWAAQKQLVWDRRDDHGQEVAPGVYFVRASRPGQETTRRLVLIR